MRRRTLLAGLAGTLGLGVGAWAAYEHRPSTAEGFEPVARQPLWMPDATTPVTIPEPGRVTLLEFFATWCTICRAKMPHLASLHEAIDEEDVQLISITFEPVGTTVDASDVVSWWHEHGGTWPVVHDEGLHFARELGITAVPTSVVFDRENRVVHNTVGSHSVEELLDLLDDAGA